MLGLEFLRAKQPEEGKVDTMLSYFISQLEVRIPARPSPLTNAALFVAGECLSTGEVRTPNRAQISAAAARPPVLTQPRVDQDPVA